MNRFRKARILIADDSEILNNLLRDVFEEDGFTVLQAFNGDECKKIVVDEQPDVAFIDVSMPGPDGIEVLGFIKSRYPDMLVVIMTGAGSERTAVQAMKLGAEEYLNKPFDTAEVVRLAEKLLETREAKHENIRLHEEIRRGERYLAHLTKIINEALITTDPAGKIEFVNRAACDLWGYSAEELHGKDVHFLVRGEARTLLYRDLVKETISHGPVSAEFHFRRKDRGTFPGYLSTSVITEGDKLRGIVMVVNDLTRLYEVESRLKQSEKLASLGRVVEGVAHEVRNCLTSLGGFAKRLRKVVAGDPKAQHYTGIILDDVSRLESMVRQIEDYVRFSRFYSFTFEKVDLVPIIEKARKRALTKLPEDAAKMVRYELTVEENTPNVSGDPAALEEVFFNLILNAYEAMPRGGKLTVSLRRNNSAIAAAISDTGVGIRREDLSEIFTPFFTSKMSGAGMGLSKAYLLVEEHRGTIKVGSVVEKGSTFEVFLPVERLLTGSFAWEAASRDGVSH